VNQEERITDLLEALKEAEDKADSLAESIAMTDIPFILARRDALASYEAQLAKMKGMLDTERTNSSFIRGQLADVAEERYKETQQKVTDTKVGKLTLRFSDVLIIDDEASLKGELTASGIRDQCIEEKLRLTALKKWLATMLKLGKEISGAHLESKPSIAVEFKHE